MPRRRKQILQLLQQTVTQRTPVLDLSNCQAGDLLDQVCQMTWLTELNLSHGHVSQLPDAFGNLTALTRLDLSENQLPALPESISQLTSLAYLNLTQAGYEFTLSVTLKEWIKRIPEVVEVKNESPIAVEQQYLILSADHPNQLLVLIKQSMKLYDDAFNMEERNFDGGETRTRADTDIQQLFDQIPELKQVLPAFYDDFKEHRFYWSNCDSEKTLDANPFNLPTEEDQAWLDTPDSTMLPVKLVDELLDASRIVSCRNTATGQQSEIVRSEYGNVLVSNQPYAEDEIYQADCEAVLYQAGSNRLYVRVTFYGRSDTPGLKWFGSANGGQYWQEQAHLTYEWLTKNCHFWSELSNLSRRK